MKITSFSNESEKELSWLKKHEDRSGSKIINRLIRKEFKAWQKKKSK